MFNDLVNMIQKCANIKADPNLTSILFGYEIRIKQINALKYAEMDSVTLKVVFSMVGFEIIQLIVNSELIGDFEESYKRSL